MREQPRSSAVQIEPGGERVFSIGCLGIRFESQLKGFSLELPQSFAPFSNARAASDLRVAVTSRESAEPPPYPLGFQSQTWGVRQADGCVAFEVYYPPTSQTIVVADAVEPIERYLVVFDEGIQRSVQARYGYPASETFYLVHPLDQLLFLNPLAQRDVFLVHACGAVIDGTAFVFAGHSGDGKTTLSRLLAAEGVELLSDERIAIGCEGGIFTAYGTPWPGEGNVVSAAAYPLGGVFILKKGSRHSVRDGRAAPLLAELLSRSIVPYCLPDVTERIVNLAQVLAQARPLRELAFSLEPGLPSFLARAAA